MDAAYCVDISEPETLRGRMPAYRLYTARWSLADLAPDCRPPTAAPDPEPGEWEVPRVPLRYERAVLAGAAVREKLLHHRRRAGLRRRRAPAGGDPRATAPAPPGPPNPSTATRSRRPNPGKR
ncbi:hypothetical protein Stsp01_65430 [Streptomyces sp. NBRC 13847]|uniref:hypothetical protein n=1 Tax=Streptomyces TaxID=1883 RepID=UPI0024A2F8B5|nr:hypothetical protein [Streptomyces sp. NBRC 13847]GLW19800.1 hypothetical protein Stsp01_65430 [Streptomyces sp. NBRC 13847]